MLRPILSAVLLQLNLQRRLYCGVCQLANIPGFVPMCCFVLVDLYCMHGTLPVSQILALQRQLFLNCDVEGTLLETATAVAPSMHYERCLPNYAE